MLCRARSLQRPRPAIPQQWLDNQEDRLKLQQRLPFQVLLSSIPLHFHTFQNVQGGLSKQLLITILKEITVLTIIWSTLSLINSFKTAVIFTLTLPTPSPLCPKSFQIKSLGLSKSEANQTFYYFRPRDIVNNICQMLDPTSTLFSSAKDRNLIANTR